jgi:hypothetical protein
MQEGVSRGFMHGNGNAGTEQDLMAKLHRLREFPSSELFASIHRHGSEGVVFSRGEEARCEFFELKFGDVLYADA